MHHVLGSQALAPWGESTPVAAMGSRWRPAPMRLAGFRPPKTLSRPGQSMDQSRAGVAALGLVPILVGGTLAAATAWVGFSTGARERGLLSAAGYVIGSLGALTALFSLLGGALFLVGVNVLPDDMIGPVARERVQDSLPSGLPLSADTQFDTGFPQG